METRYEMEPAPIGRSNDRRLPAVVGTIVVLLAVVVLKPWDGPALAPPTAPAQRSVASPATAPELAARPVAEPAVEVAPTWPAAASPTATADDSMSQAGTVLGELTVHSGTWGVGNAGVGPRLVRDEPWADWTAVAPETTGDGPGHIAIWPGTSLCKGFPTIYDRPSVMAITAPADLVAKRGLVGWWTDGAHVANLAGSVLPVSLAGNPGISYLERTDDAPWPAGRYEFHVIAGARTVALTVCLTRQG
jgi:hypothetical protein